MGNGGGTGGIQLLTQLLQVVVAFHQLLADAANQNFVGNAPEHDGRVVVVLDDQLGHLAAAVCVGILAGFEHADERNLGPNGKTDGVAGVIEILTVLVVGQTNGVGTDFLDHLGILVMVVNAQSVAFVQAVLMAGNTAQRGGHAIDGKAAVRGDGVAAHTNIDAQIVIGFIAALQAGNYGVQVGLVHAPQLSIRHIQGNGGVISRAGGGSNLKSIGIFNAVLHGKVFVRVGHIAFDFERGAAVRCRFGGNFNAGAAEIIQVKVGIGHADQVDAAVQATIEREVGGRGIHGRRIFVADFNGQLVLAVMAQIRHISAENGVTALVGGGNRSVDLDGSGKGCGQNFNIGAAAGQRLLGRSKGAGVNTGGAQIAAVAVHAIHRVPGVGQGNRFSRAFALGEGQGPVFVQGNYVTHGKSPVLLWFVVRNVIL